MAPTPLQKAFTMATQTLSKSPGALILPALLLAAGTLLSIPARAAVPSYRVDVVATYSVTTTLRGASEAGHFVGDQVQVGFVQPFVATLGDGLVPLPLPPGYLTGSALDVNTAGVVVGTVSDDGFPFDSGEPALWTPQPDGSYAVEILATPPTVFAAGSDRPTSGGQAVAINDAGTIVGWTRIQGFQGGPTTLFSTTEPPVDLGAAGFAATVRDLNENDVIVGGGLRMDLGTSEITPLGLPDPIGTVGFTDVIAYAVNDQNEAVVAANLASVVTENYLTYLHADGLSADGDGYLRLNPDQLPSRFVGFYDNNDRGDVSASGGILFRAEDVLVGAYDALLEPAFADWDVSLGFLDDDRRVLSTAFNVSTGENALVLLTPTNTTTSAPAARSSQVSAHPNPFNPRTSIVLEGIATGSTGTIEVFDARGTRVRVLHRGALADGRYEWDGRDDRGVDVSSGLYLVRVSAGATDEVVKLTLAR